MTTITLRSTKGAPLTIAEVDANFNNLNDSLPTAMDSATAQAGTNTTAQTVSASVLKAGIDANAIKTYASVSAIPSGFVGTARVGTDLYVGDGVNHVKLINPIKGVFNLDKNKYKSLANAINKTLVGLSNTRILFVGDSTTSGTGCDYVGHNEVAYSHVRRLSELLTNSGLKSGWQNYYGTSRGTGSNTDVATINTYDNRVTALPAGWSAFATGVGGSSIWNNTTTNPITFTPTVNTNSLDVYYLDADTAYNQFTVKVGATICGTASYTASNTIKKLTATTGTTATNNIWTIQRSGTGTNAIIVGFEAYDSNAKEISLINAGQGGTYVQTSFAITPVNFWDTLNELRSATLKFDAVVINFGINHWYNTTVADFENNLNLAVALLDAASIPIILHAPMMSPTPTDGGGTITLATQKLYIDALYRTAVTYNLAVIDVFNTFGTNYTLVDGYGWHGYTGDVHPSKLGYQTIAKYYKNFIDAIM